MSDTAHSSEHWRDLLQAYHDGEADAEACAEAEALVAESPEARAFLAELRTLDSALLHLAGPPPSAATYEAGLQRGRRQIEAVAAGATVSQPAGPAVASQAARSLWTRRAAYIAGAAAATVLMVLGLSWVAGPEPVPEQPAPSAAAPTTTSSESDADGSDALPFPSSEAEPLPEMLELLNLLESDLDFEALAALEPEEVSLLADVVYYDALNVFDEDKVSETREE